MVSRRWFGFIPLTLVLAAPVAGHAAAPAPPAGGNYEALAQGAAPTHDVATLLAAFIDHCDTLKRDLDRARCRASTAFLRRTLPRRTFSFQTDDPSTIAVSDYDAAVKGYHLSLAGCIACTKPVDLAGGPRFVTLKAPDKEAETLVKAVALSRNTFGFDSLVEAKRWMETARPFLRAEFLFKPTAQSKEAHWTYGASHGVALDLVGARVFHRCTGEVLVSVPPSVALAPRPAARQDDPSCAGAAPSSQTADKAPSPEDAPAQLSKAAIADAMSKIRPQVFACYQQFQVPGHIELTYVVAGNGSVQSVAVSPAFAGTPTGTCVLAAGKNARFPLFKLDTQKFTYPFFLRQ